MPFNKQTMLTLTGFNFYLMQRQPDGSSSSSNPAPLINNAYVFTTDDPKLYYVDGHGQYNEVKIKNMDEFSKELGNVMNGNKHMRLTAEQIGYLNIPRAGHAHLNEFGQQMADFHQQLAINAATQGDLKVLLAVVENKIGNNLYLKQLDEWSKELRSLSAQMAFLEAQQRILQEYSVYCSPESPLPLEEIHRALDEAITQVIDLHQTSFRESYKDVETEIDRFLDSHFLTEAKKEDLSRQYQNELNKASKECAMRLECTEHSVLRACLEHIETQLKQLPEKAENIQQQKNEWINDYETESSLRLTRYIEVLSRFTYPNILDNSPLSTSLPPIYQQILSAKTLTDLQKSGWLLEMDQDELYKWLTFEKAQSEAEAHRQQEASKAPPYKKLLPKEREKLEREERKQLSERQQRNPEQEKAQQSQAEEWHQRFTREQRTALEILLTINLPSVSMNATDNHGRNLLALSLAACNKNPVASALLITYGADAFQVYTTEKGEQRKPLHDLKVEQDFGLLVLLNQWTKFRLELGKSNWSITKVRKIYEELQKTYDEYTPASEPILPPGVSEKQLRFRKNFETLFKTFLHHIVEDSKTPDSLANKLRGVTRIELEKAREVYLEGKHIYHEALWQGHDENIAKFLYNQNQQQASSDFYQNFYCYMVSLAEQFSLDSTLGLSRDTERMGKVFLDLLSNNHELAKQIQAQADQQYRNMADAQQQTQEELVRIRQQMERQEAASKQALEESERKAAEREKTLREEMERKAAEREKTLREEMERKADEKVQALRAEMEQKAPEKDDAIFERWEKLRAAKKAAKKAAAVAADAPSSSTPAANLQQLGMFSQPAEVPAPVPEIDPVAPIAGPSL